MKNQITTKLSKTKLTLIPDVLSKDNEFDVKVINGSKQFTSFQLELTAKGLESESNLDWYKVEPEICTKNPPGSETDFHIAITKPPIPAYDSTIDLILTTFSIEDEKLSNSQKIKLKVESPQKKIDIQLPIKQFRGKPGETIEIPVTITNISPKFVDIKLKLSGLEDFEIKNNNFDLQIKPSITQTINFFCQIPQQPTKISYQFKLEHLSLNNFCQSYDEGDIEILPYGIIEFQCNNPIQSIPNEKGNQANIVCYELEFTNHTYSKEKVNLSLIGKDVSKCHFEHSDSILLQRNGHTSDNDKPKIDIKVRKERPWFGWKRKYNFAISPHLESGSKVEIKPKLDSEILRLNVSPIIPFFLQVLGLLSIPLLILWLNYLRTPSHHTAPVTSVRLTDIAGTVISGSSDGTIRHWQFNDSLWGNQSNLTYKEESDITKPIRVIRSKPGTQDRVAVGLENGKIELRDLSLKDFKETYFKPGDEKNRVFDLEFTSDSQTLIAAYGSGRIRVWNLDKADKNNSNIPKEEINANFTISTLGISENDDLPLVVVGGRYNRLAFWNWKKSQSESEKVGENKNENESKSKKIIYHLPYNTLNEDTKPRFLPISGKESYITSLIIADRKNLLVTADNKGFINSWDLRKVRECIKNPNNQKNKPDSQIVELVDCVDGKTIHNNRNDKFPSIRSIAMTKNESYLASAGDDGYVRIFKIKDKGQEISCFHKQKIGAKLNTVDIKLRKNEDEPEEILIVTGDDKHRVKLYIKEVNENANCK
jgi:WD40 repeat protein